MRLTPEEFEKLRFLYEKYLETRNQSNLFPVVGSAYYFAQMESVFFLEWLIEQGIAPTKIKE